MDTKKLEKERRNKRFAREELGDLLRMFSSLGITVGAGIALFFWAGVWSEKKLADWGWPVGKWLRIGTLLLGLGLTLYWAYLRIARHLEKYEEHDEKKQT